PRSGPPTRASAAVVSSAILRAVLHLAAAEKQRPPRPAPRRQDRLLPGAGQPANATRALRAAHPSHRCTHSPRARQPVVRDLSRETPRHAPACHPADWPSAELALREARSSAPPPFQHAAHEPQRFLWHGPESASSLPLPALLSRAVG